MKLKIRFQLLITIIAIILFVPCTTFSQVVAKKQVKKENVAKDQVIPLDSAVRVGKLSNGFTYYIRKNVEPKKRMTMYLVNKVGSILENDDQQGLAHFMEHMSFNGTKHFPKNELVSYLQKAGVRFGADLNAYTSFDETVYQLPIPTDDPELLKNGFLIMRDWAQDATLDPAEIDKERGVILEEKRLGKSAQERLQNKYLPIIFNQSRYSNRIPIGTEEVLNNFKPETIKSFYSDWYRPDLQALIVVGDIDINETEQTIKELFSTLKMPKKPRPRIDYTIPLTQKNQFFVATDKEFPVTVVQVLIKHPESKLITKSDYRQGILRSLYNSMMGARMAELSKQANPPFIQAGTSVSGFLADLDVASAVIVGKPGELENGFKTVWSEIVRAKRYGFTQTELDRAKESMMQAMESAYREREKTNSENYVREYLNLFLNEEASPGIAYEYNFYKENLGGISLQEVNGVIKKYLVDVNRDILVLGPDKEESTLPKEGDLNKWVSDVETSDIVAYEDNVSDQPLLDKMPVAGKVVSENKIDGVGVVQFTLSNGVKVELKPTDFKNDEISFSAFSPGGTSLYSDAEYESASRAGSLIKSSGVGNYNAVQLSKFLTGKQVSVAPYIGERSEGINGSATPKDLETALQLVYLYFTQPRKDIDVYNGLLSQEKASLANRSNDPGSVFSDTLSAVLGNYSVRRTGPSIEKYDQINLDRAFEIYKDRFQDASDFTFTVVGSFDVNEIKPLIEQYLGALPSTKRIEQARDLGIHIPSGKINREVFKGKEPKSTVYMVFSDVYKYNETENNLLEALSGILDIKLVEKLREEESGVYGVGSRVKYSKYPDNRYSFLVSFGCSPANVDKLVNLVFAEIKKIAIDGPSQSDVDKVLAEDRRLTEVQLKQNGFWLKYITNQLQNDDDPLEILHYNEALLKISPVAVKEAAKRYLNGENYARFVLFPDKEEKVTEK